MLSGGGFRGAYQAGFLKAAAEAGFRPRVVSGTSVGTLNAMLLRHLTPEELYAYWAHRVSFRRFYRPNPVGIAIRSTCWILLVPWMLQYALFRQSRFGGMIGQLFTDTESAIPVHQRNPWSQFSTYSIGFTPALLSTFGYVGLAGRFGYGPESDAFRYSAYAFFFLVYAVLTKAPAIFRFVDGRGLTMFHTRLHARIAEATSGAPQARQDAPEAFATVAVAERIFDYSNVEYYPPRRATMWAYERVMDVGSGRVTPSKRPTLTARYLPIEDLASSLTIAVASASLPLGMMPGLRYGGRILRDGGSADNIPVFPLLHRGLDRIVILDIARKPWDREQFVSGLRAAHRRQVLARMDHEEPEIIASACIMAYRMRKSRSVSAFCKVVTGITEALDARYGVTAPELPELCHVRLCEKRLGLTTIWASRKRIHAMQEHGYLVGKRFFREEATLRQDDTGDVNSSTFTSGSTERALPIAATEQHATDPRRGTIGR
ncbi:patatin-like phospholipase family protein [Kitasatospora sp. NPDC047058]|uniref:patatin-like phospholipase family protein n=1 Tax=Kitasatospora sp. NPDC047058 TaxID=3155620 RepID=UPI0033D59C93